MPCEAVSSSSLSVVYQVDDYQTRQATRAFSMPTPRTCQVSWAHDLFRLHVRHLLPGPVDRCHRAESGAADRSVVCPTPGDPNGLRHGLWIADDCHLLPQHPSRPVEYYTNIYKKYKTGPKTSAKKQRDGFGAEMLRDCQISPLMIFMISDLYSVLSGVDFCRCHPLFAVESLCLMTKPTISDG